MRRLGFVIVLLCLLAPASAGALEARGSARQVHVTGIEPGTAVELINAAGKRTRTRKATAPGGAVFRNVKPGAGWKVRANGETSEALTVATEDPTPPSTDIYEQELSSDGYGYMTMRDGTKLAYAVHPPTDVANARRHRPAGAARRPRADADRVLGLRLRATPPARTAASR